MVKVAAGLAVGLFASFWLISANTGPSIGLWGDMRGLPVVAHNTSGMDSLPPYEEFMAGD